MAANFEAGDRVERCFGPNTGPRARGTIDAVSTIYRGDTIWIWWDRSVSFGPTMEFHDAVKRLNPLDVLAEIALEDSIGYRLRAFAWKVRMFLRGWGWPKARY